MRDFVCVRSGIYEINFFQTGYVYASAPNYIKNVYINVVFIAYASSCVNVLNKNGEFTFIGVRTCVCNNYDKFFNVLVFFD